LIEKKHRKDHDPSVSLLRKIAIVIAGWLEKTNISPNQVTVLNFIIFTPPIIWCVLQGEYIYNLIAICLILIDSVFDLVDGILARLRGTSSKYGQQLDRNFDVFFQLMLFMGLIVGTVKATGDSSLFVWGLILVSGQAMANWIGIIYEYDFGFHICRGSQTFREHIAAEKVGYLDSYISNLIVPHNIFYIIFFTARYVLLVGILIDEVAFFIIYYSIAINIRWISMLVMYIVFLSGVELKLKTITILKILYLDKESRFNHQK